ncbi:MAG: hypothetical protein H5U03_00780 [Clostridia bacterium]|nr:hypothetical protein [Clostridia bacterium]
MPKGLGLFSGGLDSAVAIKVAQDAGAQVEALHFLNPFTTSVEKGPSPRVVELAREVGVRLRVQPLPEDYLRVITKPRFGYGRNINPCLDCRIYQFKLAASLMGEWGASYLITGEVLGQRPMSQRRDALALVDRESGLKGLVLRPLSALLLEPTIPELQGWVDRSRLLAIKGRGRTAQLELARHYGLQSYATPAGGCLLTSREFAAKLKDLIDHGEPLTFREVEKLKIGRHFRVSGTTKGIVGRNREENAALKQICGPEEMLLEVVGYKGPTTLVSGRPREEELVLLAEVTARYSDAPRGREVEVRCLGASCPAKLVRVKAAEEETLDRYRISS